MKSAKSYNARRANSGRCATKRIAIGGKGNCKSAPLKTFDVKGYISGCWMELRVKAANEDAAGAIAHERGMVIAECVPAKIRAK